MKRKNILSVLIIICLLIAVYNTRIHAVQRSQLLPPDVNMVIQISNGAAFLKALKESPYGKLWNSPEMAPFLNNQSLENAIIKSIFLSDAKLPPEKQGVDIYRKMISLYNRELVVGIGKDSLFVLAEMNDADFKKNYELMQLESKIKGEKVVYQAHPFQGVDLTREIVEGKENDSLWMAFFGNTFITTSSREWAEQCIVRLKKELPVSPTGPPTLRIKLPSGFLDQIIKRGQDEKKEAAAPNTAAPNIYKALGFGQGELAVEWIITPACSEVNFRAVNNTGAGGLWKLLSKDPVPQNLHLGYVPEEVLSYQVARLDIHSFWQEIPSILKVFGPQAPAQFQMGLKATAQMLQVDIDRDVIGNLDTLIISYSQLEGLEDRSLYAWRLRNAAAMEISLGKLFAEGGWLKNNMKDNLDTLELQGFKVYSFKSPQSQPPEEAAEQTDGQKMPVLEPVTYAVTVMDGDLIFGRLEMVRAYVHGSRDRKNSRNFYQSPLFTRMIRRVPDRVSGYGFSDFSQWIKPAVTFLKTISLTTEPIPGEEELSIENPEQEPQTPPKADPFGDYLKNLDFDRLPSAEFLRSFFGPWVSYFQFTGKEVLIKWELHNPVGKK